jgi:flagellar assembly factor FliW
MPMIMTEAPTEMIDVRTTRYGELETVRVSTEVVLTFPDGMPGFERHHRYALLQDAKLAPFFWLQSLHDPLVGFLVITPGYLVNDYAFDIADPDVEMLELKDPSEARVLTILVVPDDIRAMTANMQAPIIINPVKRIAKQVILTDERFPLRYPVFGNLRTEPRAPERRRSC